ncbi:hypothetical protein [Amycolatopsis sp. NPDC059021]|uniref:hypothetical protein n=1 Tax=Amycolatopsis sp. NPDC059021 TaxID=3346704 RepID=UPI00366E5FF6
MDRSPVTITGLGNADNRSISVHVAGPAALLVAKAHKIRDRYEARLDKPHRLVGKDASDVYRLMVTTPVSEVADSFRALVADTRVGAVTSSGLRHLRELFGGADTPGVRLAIEALAGDIPERRIRALAPAFVNALPNVS